MSGPQFRKGVGLFVANKPQFWQRMRDLGWLNLKGRLEDAGIGAEFGSRGGAPKVHFTEEGGRLGAHMKLQDEVHRLYMKALSSLDTDIRRDIERKRRLKEKPLPLMPTTQKKQLLKIQRPTKAGSGRSTATGALRGKRESLIIGGGAGV